MHVKGYMQAACEFMCEFHMSIVLAVWVATCGLLVSHLQARRVQGLRKFLVSKMHAIITLQLFQNIQYF